WTRRRICSSYCSSSGRGCPTPTHRRCAGSCKPWRPRRRGSEVAMIELTEEQRRALAATEAPRLIDPATGQAYGLVRAEEYECCKGMMGRDYPSELYPAMDRSLAEVWSGSQMDDYDRYEELRPSAADRSSPEARN